VARSRRRRRGGKVQESNEWTVGIAGGLLEGTNIRFAAEMAKVLDDRPNLRVLPIVTYGALGNVEDLLYLKGVDVTITSADVLDEFIRNGTISNIKNRIRTSARSTSMRCTSTFVPRSRRSKILRARR
jgi:hypothetical protein